MDVRDNTTTGDSRLDERVELLVTTDGELEMARRDTLHLEILGGVARQLKNFCRQVLEDGRCVHGRSGTDALVLAGEALQETVDTTNGELQAGAARPGLRLLLGGASLATLASLTALASLATLAAFATLARLFYGKKAIQGVRCVVGAVAARLQRKEEAVRGAKTHPNV